LCSRRVLSPFLTLLLQLTLAFFAIMSATEATAPAPAEEVKVVETPVAEPTPAAEPAAESAPVTVIVILY
jgi:hypothetical protein